MTYAFDPELAPIVELLPAGVLDDLETARAGLVDLIGPLNEKVDRAGVTVVDHQIPGPADARDVLVQVFTPEGDPPAGGRPAFLDIHGGGFVLGTIAMEVGF